MFELDAQQVLHVRPFLSVTTGIVVLFVGKALNQRFALLREYNIPEPVTGGLLFSVAFGLAYLVSGVKLDFELSARDILLVYFFTVIGINARVGDLARGGKPLLALLAVTVAFMLAQNLVGVGAARLLGLDPSVGLLAGSISMTGGHGTAIAWAPVIAEERGVANAMEIGVVCATMGLVLASLAGGPIARYLIRRHRLEAPRHKGFDVGVLLEAERPQIDYFSFLRAILAIHVAAIVGILLSGWLEGAGDQGAAVSALPGRRDRPHEPAAALPPVRRLAQPHRSARAHRGGLVGRVSRHVADEHEAVDARRPRRAARSAARAAARAGRALRGVRLLPGSGTRLRRGGGDGRVHRLRTRRDADRFGQHDRRNPAPRTLAARVPDRAARRSFFHRRRECARDPHVPGCPVTKGRFGNGSSSFTEVSHALAA